ncbi:hypothetical protein EJ04DRAFT_524499 [Polyplosphaeria fusca]|uniref:Uncharacterized protein n=1 Tax=Polyplosphaeria fusca TaxID=682080 RepID=A0A9P4V1T3_9PLEO|nr:hypothetical protein EJ04DRAFT_524499 [Polyplosphaeria fusca]
MKRDGGPKSWMRPRPPAGNHPQPPRIQWRSSLQSISPISPIPSPPTLPCVVVVLAPSACPPAASPLNTTLPIASPPARQAVPRALLEGAGDDPGSGQQAVPGAALSSWRRLCRATSACTGDAASALSSQRSVAFRCIESRGAPPTRMPAAMCKTCPVPRLLWPRTRRHIEGSAALCFGLFSRFNPFPALRPAVQQLPPPDVRQRAGQASLLDRAPGIALVEHIASCRFPPKPGATRRRLPRRSTRCRETDDVPRPRTTRWPESKWQLVLREFKGSSTPTGWTRDLFSVITAAVDDRRRPLQKRRTSSGAIETSRPGVASNQICARWTLTGVRTTVWRGGWQ